MALSVLVAADTIVPSMPENIPLGNCSGHYVRRLDLSVNSDNQTINLRANGHRFAPAFGRALRRRIRRSGASTGFPKPCVGGSIPPGALK